MHVCHYNRIICAPNINAHTDSFPFTPNMMKNPTETYICTP